MSKTFPEAVIKPHHLFPISGPKKPHRERIPEYVSPNTYIDGPFSYPIARNLALDYSLSNRYDFHTHRLEGTEEKLSLDSVFTFHSNPIFAVIRRVSTKGTVETTILAYCLSQDSRHYLTEITYDKDGNRIVGGDSSAKGNILDYSATSDARNTAECVGHFKFGQLPVRIDMEKTIAAFLEQMDSNDKVRMTKQPVLIPYVVL